MNTEIDCTGMSPARLLQENLGFKVVTYARFVMAKENILAATDGVGMNAF